MPVFATIIPAQGTAYQIGRRHGELAASAVRSNLESLWRTLHSLGIGPRDLLPKACSDEALLSAVRRREIQGIAWGSRLPYLELLAYNLYHDVAFPEECTVIMAVGSACAGGRTLFMKNSDQVGSEKMAGPHFHRNKEIYVVQVAQLDGGNRIVGVSAAGSTGIKMGMNDKGVAAGSNIARTKELAKRRVDIAQIRASDRTQLLRDGLEQPSARAAAQRIMAKLMEAPTSTPGNIEFADALEGWIIEGSYDRVAVEVLRNQVGCRANRFQIMETLNSPQDVSSICRYVRCQQLLAENADSLTFEKLIEFSQDHANGPGPNSICRHGDHFRDETSLGGAVIEINAEQPERSRIAIALGKPCHAWSDPDGWLILEAGTDESQVPQQFLDGSVWKRFYSEEPYSPEPSPVASN
ncbi:MAG: C45 family autoproteolytic acyltransferase/hydrolase [Dehalococcoidia bacterium]